VNLLKFTFIGAIALAFLTCARGQTPTPAFEVASIRPNRSGSADSNMNSLPSGKLIATNVALRELIRLAYGVRDYQIAKAPGWIDSVRYDISAETASPKKVSHEESAAMLRELLVDRFQLALHRETKEGPVYLLTVGKNGPKLTEHNEGTGSGARGRCGHLTGKRLTLDTVARVLSRQFERDVLNRTGLNGKYDFELDWTPDAGPCSAAESEGATEPFGRPSIFTAVQEQLGLKLEPAKGPVEMLVIDRVSRPSEN
jgi:uncharacterized protein (TIGR03435 family)